MLENNVFEPVASKHENTFDDQSGRLYRFTAETLEKDENLSCEVCSEFTADKPR